MPFISLFVYMCILSLLGNGPVKTLPRQGSLPEYGDGLHSPKCYALNRKQDVE
jgi:hypothetical protein